MHIVEEQASITAACVLSLKLEEEQKAALSEGGLRDEARERFHKDEVDKIRVLEDQIRHLARFPCLLYPCISLFL